MSWIDRDEHSLTIFKDDFDQAEIRAGLFDWIEILIEESACCFLPVDLNLFQHQITDKSSFVRK